MKGIDTPGQALDPGGFVPHFPPQGAGYLTLLSRHSLGNGNFTYFLRLKAGKHSITSLSRYENTYSKVFKHISTLIS
jgi:hypothetical protein